MTKYFNKNIIYIFSIFILSIFTFVLLINKYENFGFANYDFGIFFFKINQINQEFYSYILHGHSNLYLLFFSFLLKLISLNQLIYFCIFLKVFILLSTACWIKFKLNNFVAYLYLLYFPVWFLIMDNYNFDYLVIPLSLFLFYYYEHKRFLICFILCIAIIALKEFFSLFIFIFSVYIFFKRKLNKFDYIFSIIVGFISLTSFYILTHYLITTSAWNNTNINQNSFFGKNIFSFLSSAGEYIYSNIHLSIDDLFTKLKFFIFPFMALFFLNLLSFRYLIFFFPIFLISILSPDLNHSGYGHHYYATIIAPSIYSIYELMRNEKYKNWILKYKQYIILFVLIIHFFISPSPFSKLFFSNKIEKYGYEIYFKNDEYKGLSSFLDTLSDKDITIAQNNIIHEKIIKNNHMLVFPQGVFEPVKVIKYEKNKIDKYGTNNNIYVNYIIMDINRENFILDRSCLKIYNECSNKEILNKYNRYFVKIKDEFDLKYKNKGIYVFKRKDKF